MIGFLKVHQINLPLMCLKSAYSHMRAAGRRGVEGIALFAGQEKAGIFEIKETIIPEQIALGLEQGLLYAVGEEELHRINVELYHSQMNLIAQIHSHPNEAYHSATDDAYPIIATIGGISIVVPNFARGAVSLESCAVYRLSPGNIWEHLSQRQVKSLIKLT